MQAKWAWEGFNGRAVPIDQLSGPLVHLDESTRVSPERKNVAVYAELQQIMNGVSSDLRTVFAAHRGLIS